MNEPEERKWSSLTGKKELLKKILKKDTLSILVLSGILLMVIVWPVEKEGKESTAQVNQMTEYVSHQSDWETEYKEKTELQLEQLLSKMEGVGECDVMITFVSSYENIVLKDLDTSTRERTEDTQEGSLRENEGSLLESTVYYTDENGNEVPFLTKSIYPSVEGVVVVAEGGNSPEIIMDITEVIQALFGIEAHKIRVVEMNSE